MRRGYRVRYADEDHDDFEEEEIRPLLKTTSLPARVAIVDAIAPAFEYLESRLLGTCDDQYSCAHMYEVRAPRVHAAMPPLISSPKRNFMRRRFARLSGCSIPPSQPRSSRPCTSMP